MGQLFPVDPLTRTTRYDHKLSVGTNKSGDAKAYIVVSISISEVIGP